jgi:hypothetical protein
LTVQNQQSVYYDAGVLPARSLVTVGQIKDVVLEYRLYSIKSTQTGLNLILII